MATSETLAFPVYDLLSQTSCGREPSESLVCTDSLEVLRLKLSRGTINPIREAAADLLVFCMTGRVVLEVDEGAVHLGPAEFVHLPGDVSASIRAVEESVVAIVNVGVCKPRSDQAKPSVTLTEKSSRKQMDVVEQASVESFPASDPPSWTPGCPK